MSKEELEALALQLKTAVDEGHKTHSEAVSEMKKALDGVSVELEKMKSRLHVSLPGVNEQKEKFSFAKAAYGITTGDWSLSAFEKDVFDQSRKKALSTGTPSAGGYLVPEQFVAELIEMLRAESIAMKLGARMLNPAVSTPINIPRQIGGATAYWLGENSAITPSQQTMDRVQLTPKMVAALVKSSQRLLAMGEPSVELMIRQDMAIALALAIDEKVFQGDGTNDTPVGILNTPNINSYAVGADGDETNYDLLLALEGMLEDENALRGATAYAGNPKVFRKLKKQKIAQFSGQTDGMPIFAPIVSDAMLASSLGHQIGKSTQILANLTKGTGTALSRLFFGNFNELLIAQWGGLMLDASNTAGDSTGGAFSSNQTWFKAVMEVDCALRHPKSFAVATHCTTT
jgi:HK97 family phage major capsid protein